MFLQFFLQVFTCVYSRLCNDFVCNPFHSQDRNSCPDKMIQSIDISCLHLLPWCGSTDQTCAACFLRDSLTLLVLASHLIFYVDAQLLQSSTMSTSGVFVGVQGHTISCSCKQGLPLLFSPLVSAQTGSRLNSQQNPACCHVPEPHYRHDAARQSMRHTVGIELGVDMSEKEEKCHYF